MSKQRKKVMHLIQNQLSDEDLLEHYERMEQFWRAAGSNQTAAQYRGKAERLRKRLGVVT